MKRLVSFLLFFMLLLSFCGCNKEEVTRYNLNIISPSFQKIHSHYAPSASDSDKYVIASSLSYDKYLTGERMSVLKSLTICDENITDETAQ